MANFNGTARSNYVKVKDVAAATAALEPFGNEIHKHPDNADYIAIFGGCYDTGIFLTTMEDDDGDDIELDFAAWAQEHLAPGQVLVLMTAGAEKQRYVSAWAEAHTWDGRSVAVRLDTELDNLIRSVLGLDPDSVAPATYLNFSEGAKPAGTSVG